MMHRPHLALWLLAVLVLALLPPIIGGAAPVRARLAAEAAAIRAMLPAAAAERLLGVAAAVGVMPPQGGAPAEQRSAPAPGFAPLDEAARALAAVAEALEQQRHAVTLRAVLAAAWLLVLLPLWLAVLVDGLALRARKFETLGFQNPTAFTLGLHLAIVLAALPLLYLVAPFPVTPWFMPWWSLAAALPVGFALTHAQPVFTR